MGRSQLSPARPPPLRAALALEPSLPPAGWGAGGPPVVEELCWLEEGVGAPRRMPGALPNRGAKAACTPKLALPGYNAALLTEKDGAPSNTTAPAPHFLPAHA